MATTTPLTLTAVALAAIRADSTLSKAQRDALYKEIDACHAAIQSLGDAATIAETTAELKALVAKLQGFTPSVPEEPIPPTPPTTEPEPPVVVNPGGWRANEPTGDGWKPQVNIPFEVMPELEYDNGGQGISSEGTVTWYPDRDAAQLKIVPDPTAPFGPNVLQTTFPAGFGPGAAPARFGVYVPNGTPRGGNFAPNKGDIYSCFYVKRSSNWYEEGAGTKLFFQRPWGEGGMNAYISMSRKAGTTSSRLPTMCFPTNETYDCRSSEEEIADGVWHLVETLWIAGTPGEKDGTAKLWVDGKLVIDAKEIMMFPAGTTAHQDFLMWDPTFGGGGAPVRETQQIYLDHLYVSVR